MTLNDVKKYFIDVHNQNDELIWAKTWDDTKKGIQWIDDMPAISPGRWAVGYNYLYVMTRVLNELKPHSILEFGLGISSTLVSYYLKSQNFPDARHVIIEHDKDWAAFYTKNKRITDESHICFHDVSQHKYKGNDYNAYDGLDRSIASSRFSVISIDGPIGSDIYSRRDILQFLPDILEDSFVIIMDDTQRKGENKTLQDIKDKLHNSGISYCNGAYAGMSECSVITSDDNKFVCSM